MLTVDSSCSLPEKSERKKKQTMIRGEYTMLYVCISCHLDLNDTVYCTLYIVVNSLQAVKWKM